MVVEIDGIQRILTAKSAGLSLHDRGKSPVELPGNYLTLGWKELENRPELLSGLIRCYQEVYGSDEKGLDGSVLWGEGGMCSGERWGVTVPLEEYKKLQTEGGAVCPHCGSDLIECYPARDLTERIKVELTSGDKPFLTLMLGDEKMPVAGFAWGSILSSPEDVGLRLIRTRYADNPGLGKQIVAPLVGTLEKEGVEEVVFFDEFAVHPDYRNDGFDPVRFLAREGFEVGMRSGTTQELFWTKKASRIFPITYAFGFEPVGEVGELTFMLNRDVRPTLKMLQNLSEPELGGHLLRSLGRRDKKDEG